MSARAQHLAARQRSLTLRFVTLTVAGQILFGVALGAGAGLYVAVSEHQARLTYMDEVGVAMGASLLPLLMDRDVEAAQAQLDSVRLLGERTGLVCLRFMDGSGRVIAASCAPDEPCEVWEVPETLKTRLLGPTYVERDISLGEVRLGTVSMVFAERSFLEEYGTALLVTLLVAFSAVLVSAAWFTWLAVRTIIEPIQQIQCAAEELAEGERDIDLGFERKDELGLLADSLEDLARQLSANEELLRAAAVESERAREMEARARTDIEQLNQMKSDFVAVASHEIATPLSVVKLYSDLMSAGEICELSGDAVEVAEGLRSAAARLNSIVSDLRDVALLERGLMHLTHRVFDLTEVVAEAGRDNRRLAEARSITVDTFVDEFPVEVWGDPTRLRQVLDNLLSNAVKYSPEGGVITLACRAEGSEAVVEVTDRGRGIPGDRESEVFGLFGRLDYEDNRQTAGLGLGLAISARIAEAHGATIGWRDNPDGSGTVFALRMPLLSALEGTGPRETDVPLVGTEEHSGDGDAD
jgi:signal transduction histidine kinase